MAWDVTGSHGGFLNQIECDEGEIGVNKLSGQSKRDRVVK